MLRSLLISALFLFGLFSSFSQEQYTLDGKTYSLNTNVEGPITLLWNTIDGDYRYFLKKGNEIIELKNTRENKEYMEEYKEILRQQTADISMNVSGVDLTLASLRSFFISYNKRKDPSLTYQDPATDFRFRLGAFGGIMNNMYYVNPGNDLLFQAGFDFEMIENVKLRRHSLVLQFRQVFSSSDYDFTSSQFSLNYRFKYVQTETLDLFVNVKVASFTYVDRTVTTSPSSGTPVTLSGSGSEFQGPLGIGLGADIPLGNGMISIAYNDIVAVTLNNNGDFPVDFTLGYKFRL